MINSSKLTLLLFTACAVSIVSSPALQAQTYFAGTGAGTGNAGILVTAVGYNALHTSNSGNAIAAFGSYALYKNTSGSNNTALGHAALYTNVTGSYNTATGNAALFKNISGSRNTATGFNALFANDYGSENTATGYNTLAVNYNGFYNTATGYNALAANYSGNNNTANGHLSLASNTSGGYNTAIGNNTLELNTTGSFNTALGNASLKNNIGGTYNTATGHYALLQNTTGWGNAASGAYSLNANTSGSTNTSMGLYNLYRNTTGSSNTSIGQYGSYNNQTGQGNATLGSRALYSNVTGNYNVAIGVNTAELYGAYSNCTFAGAFSDAAANGLSNATAIGYNTKVDASNKVVIGNTAVTSIGGQVGWTTYSDQHLKTDIKKSTLGLDFVLALNPVTYHYKADGQQGIEYTGLIAQEVDAAAKKAGIMFSAVDKTGNYWGIRYAELTVPLIKAVQESAAENQQLKSRVEKLELLVQQLQQNNTGNASAIKYNSAILLQNQPNPYSQSTLIQYDLKQANQKASIEIRDGKGSLVKLIALQQVAGKGRITIAANELAAGTYTYSLLFNNSVADTKLMVVAR